MTKKIQTSLRKDMEQQASYYNNLSQSQREAMATEAERNDNLLKGLMQMEQQFKMMKEAQAPQPVVNQASTDTAKP